jgi:hypothetical protein
LDHFDEFGEVDGRDEGFVASTDVVEGVREPVDDGEERGAHHDYARNMRRVGTADPVDAEIRRAPAPPE